MSFTFYGKFKTKDEARSAVANSNLPGTIKGYVFDAILHEREPAEGQVLDINAYGHLCRDAQDTNGTTASVLVKYVTA